MEKANFEAVIQTICFNIYPLKMPLPSANTAFKKIKIISAFSRLFKLTYKKATDPEWIGQ